MIDHHTLYIKLKRKMIKSDIKKGDIYYATLNPAIGSEQKGERPVNTELKNEVKAIIAGKEPALA